MENSQKEECLQLEKQIDSEPHLRAELAKWNACYEEIQEQQRQIYNARKKLQKEIEKLEKHSLKSLAYHILSKHRNALDRLHAEDDGLAAQYEEALAQQKEPEAQIHFYENELLKIKGAKRRLAQMEEEVTAARISAVRETDAQVRGLEEEISSLQETSRQLRHILQTARGAHATAREILDLIENAEQIGWLDLYGGNLFTGLEKHKQLNRAQNLLDSLAEQTKLFEGELANIHLQEGFSIRVGGFLKFSDYAFDGLIADALVLRQIKKAYEPLRQFCRQVESVIYHVNARLTAAEEERARKQGRLQQRLFHESY